MVKVQSAFDRRCIPPGVAQAFRPAMARLKPCPTTLSRSNTAGILPLFALPDGRITGLGATRNFYHGLLVVCPTNGWTLPGRGIPPAGVAPRSDICGERRGTYLQRDDLVLTRCLAVACLLLALPAVPALAQSRPDLSRAGRRGAACFQWGGGQGHCQASPALILLILCC